MLKTLVHRLIPFKKIFKYNKEALKPDGFIRDWEVWDFLNFMSRGNVNQKYKMFY
jgi:hypothetical protein